jgi:hypothetical protein
MRFKNVSLTGTAVASRLAATWLAVGIAAVTAQETNELVRIDFRNKVPGVVDAPVFNHDGVTRLEGRLWMTELYAGPDANSFAAVVGSAFLFLTGADAGYWDYTTPNEVIPSFLPTLGQRIWFQVRIYEFVPDFPFWKPVYVGSSRIYSMVITNFVMPMVGLESFKLELERLEISVEGDQAIIQWQYLAASRYELRSTIDLKPPVSWTPIFEWSADESGYPPSHYVFSVTNVVTDVPQFYRLERWRY